MTRKSKDRDNLIIMVVFHKILHLQQRVQIQVNWRKRKRQRQIDRKRDREGERNSARKNLIFVSGWPTGTIKVNQSIIILTKIFNHNNGLKKF